jgi:hypothetical protein
VVRCIVRDLDATADSITTSYARVARVERRVINALAFRTFKRFASEPVVSPTALTLGTVGTVVTGLSADASARQYASLEAILSSLLLGFGREIVGIEEFIDYSLILADAVANHTSVIAICIDAHLDVDNVSSLVGHKRCAPTWTRLIIVDAYASVISAWSAATDFGSVDIGPSCHWLEDGTFWACIGTRL